MRKSASSHTTRSSSASRKRGVAQLGEQAKWSISPIKVPTHQGFVADISMIQAAKFAAEAGISLSQLEVGQITALPEDSWKWEYGKSLVPPDQINLLPTQMRKLHHWYLKFTKEEQTMILVKVTKEHYIGEDQVQIYFEELYMLYKLEALDLSLVGTYCL